jgi:tryptophanyl-tRNA synthetase
MERMTQFKVRSRRSRERASVGLFNYPALMASDILLYDTRYVPVGDDQRQHVELCRDVAERMNRLLGDVFVLPEARVSDTGARIMGLDDPELKMSKTEALRRPNHALGLLDPPDLIRSKLARAKTDNEPAVGFPAGPGVRNLLEIHRALHDLGWEAVGEEFAGKTYGALKEAVAASVIEALEPIQVRYRELRKDDGAVEGRLRASAERVAPIARRTLERVQAATGLRRGLSPL